MAEYTGNVIDNRDQEQKFFDAILSSNEAAPLGSAFAELGMFNRGATVTGGNFNHAMKESLRSLYQGLARNLGHNPGIDQFKDFLGKNLDLNLAKDLLSGRVDAGTVNDLANQYKTSINAPQNPQASIEAQRLALENTAREQQALEAAELQKLQGQQEQAATDVLKEQYGQELKRQGIENAQTGRLNQPAMQENVNRESGKFFKSLGDTIGQIRSSGVQAGMQSRNSLLDRLQGNNQFGQNLGLQQQQFGLSQELGRGQLGTQRKSLLEQIRQYDLGRGDAATERDQAALLGRLQAEKDEPGVLDYVNAGVGVASGLTGLAGGISNLMKPKKPKTTGIA